MVLKFLTRACTTKILKLKSLIARVLLLCIGWLQLNEDVYVTDVYEHVGLKYRMSWVHFLENSKSNLQIPNIILLVEKVEPDLEVPPVMLLTL